MQCMLSFLLLDNHIVEFLVFLSNLPIWRRYSIMDILSRSQPASSEIGGLNVVVHACDPGTWAVEAGGFSSSLKLVWST